MREKRQGLYKEDEKGPKKGKPMSFRISRGFLHGASEPFRGVEAHEHCFLLVKS